uniref:Uncharacterized protein LOC102810425 n=1 Tax=Saccoglossus kowalevskii TaxID=10224 RepID=A0ABM0MJX8_SACKO|nr:PREDICTED: uncharacterized protein LOC102810425 [Saccoglossus kowalevskii]
MKLPILLSCVLVITAVCGLRNEHGREEQRPNHWKQARGHPGHNRPIADGGKKNSPSHDRFGVRYNNPFLNKVDDDIDRDGSKLEKKFDGRSPFGARNGKPRQPNPWNRPWMPSIDNVQPNASPYLRKDGDEEVGYSDSKSREIKNSEDFSVNDRFSYEDTESYSVEDTGSYSVEDTESYSVEDTESYSVEDTESYSVEDTESYSVEDTESYSVEDTESYSVEDTGSYNVEDTESYNVEDTVSDSDEDSGSGSGDDTESDNGSGGANYIPGDILDKSRLPYSGNLRSKNMF